MSQTSAQVRMGGGREGGRVWFDRSARIIWCLSPR